MWKDEKTIHHGRVKHLSYFMRLGDVKICSCTFVKKINFEDERNLIYLLVWEIKKNFGGVLYLIFVLEIRNV